ncbi:transcription termination/antitermination protein NusG [Patescibacteria group bacterium]|nr:transcription termination/antitermination protein NusG [Patescibacteria group bacterium]MBU3922974.1 transcription termination/antitermination protein NusG [Patescibacteria group bacterium]
MPKQQPDKQAHWYAIHTYPASEDTVSENLKQRIDSMDMGDKIFEILVPKEKKIKIKSGKRYTIEEKIFPNYVFVKMIVTDDSWYVVRNTPRVTGFIGSGVHPVPISDEEVKKLTKKSEKENAEYKIEVEVDDPVKVIDGPFKDFDGKISEVDKERGRVKVLVNMFGRETPVEVDFLQVKKI